MKHNQQVNLILSELSDDRYYLIDMDTTHHRGHTKRFHFLKTSDNPYFKSPDIDLMFHMICGFNVFRTQGPYGFHRLAKNEDVLYTDQICPTCLDWLMNHSYLFQRVTLQIIPPTSVEYQHSNNAIKTSNQHREKLMVSYTKEYLDEISTHFRS